MLIFMCYTYFSKSASLVIIHLTKYFMFSVFQPLVKEVIELTLFFKKYFLCNYSIKNKHVQVISVTLENIIKILWLVEEAV